MNRKVILFMQNDELFFADNLEISVQKKNYEKITRLK